MIKFENVSFNYKSKYEKNGIKDIDFTINKGELLLFCGESGCGKTTIMRIINGLIPHYYEGELSGNVTIDGKELKTSSLSDIAKSVGSVFQNPRTQFFNVDTTSELAFGCENLAVLPNIIEERIAKTVKELEITDLVGRSIFKLSGGEKQKVACASVSVLNSEIVVLDEPSSNLDLIAIAELKEVLKRWKNEGKTIIVAEHRLYYLTELVDRVFYMKKGFINKIFSGDEFKKLKTKQLNDMGLRISKLKDIKYQSTLDTEKQEKLILKDAVYSYEKKQTLNIPLCEIPQNEIIAVVGYNGAGKTTFARCLCGLLKERKSRLISGQKSFKSKQRIEKSYMVMQDVNHQLFAESVIDEVLLGMEIPDKSIAKNYLEELDLLQMKDRHPMSLSGGEKQRLAVAGSLSSEKEFLIFDEPTSGLDLRHMKEVSAILKELKEKGKTIFVITHDLELLADCCNYVLHIMSGEVYGEYFLDNIGHKKLFKTFIDRL